MSLVTVKADFTRLVAILERIADILERAFPPAVIPTIPPAPYGVADLVYRTDEELCEMEAEAERQQAEQMSR